jgi:hypothetical protein
MDVDLKAYLDLKFGAMDAKFETMDAKFETMDAKFEARLSEVRAEIEKTETKLLTAFHGWARTTDSRMRGMASQNLGFEERLDLMEERVSELERRRAS